MGTHHTFNSQNPVFGPLYNDDLVPITVKDSGSDESNKTLNHESNFVQAQSSASVNNVQNDEPHPVQAHSSAVNGAQSHTDIDNPSGPEAITDSNKPSSHSVSWDNPIETSSIPTLKSRRCDSNSGNIMSSSLSMDGDDDNFDDNDDGTGSIIISNLEMLDQEMSRLESSFFDARKHLSDPDNELMLLLDI